MPIAEETLNLPPTQSQKQNTLDSIIPNLDVLASSVLTAQKWLEMICFSLKLGFVQCKELMNHSLTVVALRIVSDVVKVLLRIITRVDSGSRPSFY
jgi:hypothetical protein